VATTLWSPIDLGGGLSLPNRIVLAPCTRNRSTADLSPPEDAIEHYASRADAGLLISEATLVAPEAQGYIDTPGLFLDSHEHAWSRVVDAVHARGGRIFLQVWHTGRIAHSFFSGVQPVGVSEVCDRVPRRQAGVVGLFNERPRAVRTAEVAELVTQHRRCAQRARRAGFDGVEVHGANGYLIEQFLRRHTNDRRDAWGGEALARARFGIEVVRACLEVFGPGRVGLRLSPAAYFGEMVWSQGDNEAYEAMLTELAGDGLAYVHTGIVDDLHYDELGGTSTEFLRTRWPHRLMANGGYTPARAQAAIASGACDLVSFGKLFLANPDLVMRMRAGLPLQAYSPSVRMRPTYARSPDPGPDAPPPVR
jgi:2,4-dienoyl-CoA reductase-like NADH-dependent reductase (Old Yellow Enzyme family)